MRDLARQLLAIAILPAASTPPCAAGAAWFTRQEERRLVDRLDDPEVFARYRERVPALIPRFWPCRRR